MTTIDENQTLYLIRYDVTSGPDKGEILWGYIDRQKTIKEGIQPNGYPWLIDVKTRNQWARAYKKYGSDADRSVAGTWLDLIVVTNESLAREIAREYWPGAYDGYNGTMSFPTTTMAKLKAAKLDPGKATATTEKE